eukprot:jgi/Botrbrau1/4369/Bobra.105_2s0015.1
MQISAGGHVDLEAGSVQEFHPIAAEPLPEEDKEAYQQAVPAAMAGAAPAVEAPAAPQPRDNNNPLSIWFPTVGPSEVVGTSVPFGAVHCPASHPVHLQAPQLSQLDSVHSDGDPSMHHLVPQAVHADEDPPMHHLLPKAVHADGDPSMHHLVPQAVHADEDPSMHHLLPKGVHADEDPSLQHPLHQAPVFSTQQLRSQWGPVPSGAAAPQGYPMTCLITPLKVAHSASTGRGTDQAETQRSSDASPQVEQRGPASKVARLPILGMAGPITPAANQNKRSRRKPNKAAGQP